MAEVQRDPTYNVRTPHRTTAHQYSILNFFGTKQIRNDYFLCKKSQGIFKQDYKRRWQSTTTLASDSIKNHLHFLIAESKLEL